MKLTKEEIEVFSGEPIELFYQGIKSPVTKKKYTDILRKILCETLEELLDGSFEQRAKQLVLEAKQNPEWATGVFLALAKRLKERTQLDVNHKNYLNPNSVPNFFKPLKKLFDMNAVPMSWPRVYAALPESNNNSEGRGYTRQEIQDLLKFAKGALDRAIILVAASSGIREGGFSLEWQDLKPVYKIDDKLTFEITESEEKIATVVCAMLTIYRNTNESYPAFITPETYQALMDYKMTWFKETGRLPKPNDPIFKNAGPSPLPLSPSGIRARIYRVAKSAGVWIPASGGKRRSEIPIMNGFRRFFNKVNKETLSKDSPLAALIKKEYMMAHVGLTKLDRNYFQTHTIELIEEYLNAVPNLTISDEDRTKIENRKLRTEKLEIEKKNEELKATKEELERIKHNISSSERENKINVDLTKSLQDTIARLEDRLQKQETVTSEIIRIHNKTKEVHDRETNPANPNFPDGDLFDTRFSNLKIEQINEKSFNIIDTEFDEVIEVILRENEIYCKLDKSNACKHVLFALGNPTFYQITKKHNVTIPSSILDSRTSL